MKTGKEAVRTKSEKGAERISRPLASRARSDGLVFDHEAGLERLLEIMARLRAPDGCDWDRRQTWTTIAPYTVEEAHEVAEAIARGEPGAIRDELGDLLLQVVYHARIAEEAGAFALDDVITAIADKMLRRHPHVFGERPGGPKADPADVDWEAMKRAERATRGQTPPASALDGVPASLPALARALRLTRKAAAVGFDWTDVRDVIAKIAEEAGELAGARDEAASGAVEEEYGDLLFVMVNLARHLKIDLEVALTKANVKFERRFHAIEAALRAEGRRPEGATLAEMDALWDRAKAGEKAR